MKTFSGGLDVDKNFDGTHSIFSKYKNYEIMFHVSTLLTHEPDDPQQLAKKKHIGNGTFFIPSLIIINYYY